MRDDRKGASLNLSAWCAGPRRSSNLQARLPWPEPQESDEDGCVDPNG